MNSPIRAFAFVAVIGLAMWAGQPWTASSASALQTRPGATTSDQLSRNLATFDDLGYNVFSNQKWDELKKSHSPNVIVHWPDGRVTKGIEQHIEDLKGLFVYAPDTRIMQHPVAFGSGEWTSVIGIMEGTFTKPMPVPNSKPLAPTGKAFKVSMSTVARWNAQGTMDEEHLFWDNATYMKQLGIGQ